jgi:hypothetical protein
VASSETFALNGGTTTVVVTNTASGKQIVSTADVNDHVRKVQSNIVFGTGVAFHYGIQSGNGGFLMSQSSSVTGNVYSSGPVTGSGNYIYGDVVSSGSSGSIVGIHATGTAYAHNLGSFSGTANTIDKNAYYQVKANTTVLGTSYPNSTDQPNVALPISDSQISEWETDAAAGGTMLSSACDSYSSGTCSITSNKTLGPIKIPFNLRIRSGATLTVAGPIWVTGNIYTENGPTIKLSSTLGNYSVPIIADDPSNRSTGSIINIGQSTVFQGSGNASSFAFMISQNNSAENGGSVTAIDLGQSSSALVTYAGHGKITLGQSSSAKEVTAYQIVLSQSANVRYDTGLPNTLFSEGPSGGYETIYWGEVQ